MQLDIFAPPQTLARRSDPETSHKAAARVAEFANGHHEQIVAVLREHGRLTVYEIASFCSLDAHRCGKRMNELQRMGLAAVATENGVEVERRTPSGRMARVWEAI